MGRKGGGRKAFLKGVKPGEESDEDDMSKNAPPAKKPLSDDAPAKPDKSAMFKVDAPKPQAPPAAAAATATDSSRDDGQGADLSDETRGQLQQRHKREVKVLKEQIKKLGKKNKDECIRLEEQLHERHAAEVAAMDAREGGGKAGGEAAVAVADSLYAVRLDGSEAGEKIKKPTKAQRQREKKAAREAEREARIAQELADMPETERAAEERALRRMLRPLGMRVHEIPPDGHCLYRSVEHQLLAGGQAFSLDVKGLRKAASEYMWLHRADFMPFFEGDGDEDEDEEEEQQEGGEEALHQEEEQLEKKRAEARFKAYCKKVDTTAAWGGHMELQALSKTLRRMLVVYAVGLPPVELGEEFADKGEPLRVCYHRHSYALGEHYNSVVVGAPPDSEEEEEEAAGEREEEEGQQQQQAGEEKEDEGFLILEQPSGAG